MRKYAYLLLLLSACDLGDQLPPPRTIPLPPNVKVTSRLAEVESKLSPADLIEFRRVAAEREISRTKQAIYIPGLDCSFNGCVEISELAYECAHYYSSQWKKCDLFGEGVANPADQSFPLGCWRSQYDQLISPTSGMARFWVPLGNAGQEYGLCFEIDTYEGKYTQGLFVGGIANLGGFQDAYMHTYGIENYNTTQILSTSGWNVTSVGFEYKDWLGRSTNQAFAATSTWIRVEPWGPNQYIRSLVGVSDPPWM